MESSKINGGQKRAIGVVQGVEWRMKAQMMHKSVANPENLFDFRITNGKSTYIKNENQLAVHVNIF